MYLNKICYISDHIFLFQDFYYNKLKKFSNKNKKK